MKLPITCAVLLVLASSGLRAQRPVAWPASTNSATETVELLWISASAGDLLTSTGWLSASGLFTDPLPPPKAGVRVMSNYWGPPGALRKLGDNAVDVLVGCWHLGTIDAALRFAPAPKTDAVKESELYHLVFAPTHGRTFENGKILQSEDRGYPPRWQISRPLDMPFTTVNTAIRYVLEKREKTSDPVIKKNADKTLAALLRLH